MIHQFILAAPKPGMTTQEFQDYWLHVHAVKFATKIPQVRRYLLDTRIPFDGDLGRPALPHQGIAEIWLADEAEQLASLQTDEFIHGARADEPNWAAFWLSIVVDTTAHEIVPGTAPAGDEPSWVKMTTLLKRRPGMTVADFRESSLRTYAPAVARLPGLRRYLHCHTRDGAYVFGEAPFDGVEQWWFDDEAALHAALGSVQYTGHVQPSRAEIVDPNHLFSLTAREHWVMR
jgi:hypothetical protein